MFFLQFILFTQSQIISRSSLKCFKYPTRNTSISHSQQFNHCVLFWFFVSDKTCRKVKPIFKQLFSSGKNKLNIIHIIVNQKTRKFRPVVLQQMATFQFNFSWFLDYFGDKRKKNLSKYNRIIIILYTRNVINV